MDCIGVIKETLRVQDRGVGNVKGRSIEFLEDNLCHPFPIGWSVPCGLCDENWVVRGINMHNILQCMADEWRYRIEVLN
jgi:hypothetical protein